MTKTIKEITEKFDEIINVFVNHKNFDNIDNKTEFKSKLEEVVCSFSDDSDTFAIAFAALITCVIRYNLGDENQSYQDTLSDCADRIVPADFEDSETLKQFLKDFSVAVCENDYEDKMIELYDNYSYSVVALYLFGYSMFKYCHNYNDENHDINENQKNFEILKNIYHRLSSCSPDLVEYVLGLGQYDTKIPNVASPKQLLPFCYFKSSSEILAEYISDYWKTIAQKLNISSTESIKIENFMSSFCEYYLKKTPTDSWTTLPEFCYMTKKIGTIIKSNKEERFFYWNDNKINKSDSLAKKNNSLHIPIQIPKINNFNELLNTTIMLDNEKDELEKAQKAKREIINDFSHRYKNMRTTSLHNVANALIKMESKDLKKYGRTVLLEYGIKENLKKEVEILQLYFEDNIAKLKEKIQNSTEYSPQDNYSIYDIINNAIKKCMITLVHDGSDEPRRIRAVCFKGYDLISIRNSFEENILFEENSNTQAWFSENLAELHISISEAWKKIFFKQYQYADNILTDLLVDLIMNDLKYADKTKPLYFAFTDNDDFLIIQAKNTVVQDTSNIPGAGVGLASQNKLLNVLNNTEHKLDKSITFNEQNGEFSIKIIISKKLLEGNENI